MVYQLLNYIYGIEDLKKLLFFKSGIDFKYGNLSFNLLGKIVEFIFKKSYFEMVNILFKELKMKNIFCYFKEKIEYLVIGYSNDKNIFEKIIIL